MFNLDPNGKIIIDPNILMVPEFKEIWESDKSKTKDYAYSVFSGIYFLSNPMSPYWDWEDGRKIKEIENIYFKPYGIKIKDKNIQEANKKYLEFINTNPSQFLLEAAKETIYKLAQHLKTVPITSGKDGNILQVSNTMDKLAKTFASYDTLKQAIEKEKLNTGRKRGSQEIGYDEE